MNPSNADGLPLPTTRREVTPFDGPRWHRVLVTTEEPGAVRPVSQTTEGGDAVTAAWLRAVADQIDPPKPPRPNLREDGGSRRGPIIQERRVPGQVAVLPQSGDAPPPGGGWVQGPQYNPLSGQ